MKNFNKILAKKYLGLFIAEMAMFYVTLFFALAIVYDVDIRTSAYIGLALIAGHYSYKFNLDIKREAGNKNLFFVFAICILGLLMYLYYFNKYEIEVFKTENWLFLISFLALIGGEIYQYHKTVEEIEKENNFNFWEFIKR